MIGYPLRKKIVCKYALAMSSTMCQYLQVRWAQRDGQYHKLPSDHEARKLRSRGIQSNAELQIVTRSFYTAIARTTRRPRSELSIWRSLRNEYMKGSRIARAGLQEDVREWVRIASIS